MHEYFERVRDAEMEVKLSLKKQEKIKQLKRGLVLEGPALVKRKSVERHNLFPQDAKTRQHYENCRKQRLHSSSTQSKGSRFLKKQRQNLGGSMMNHRRQLTSNIGTGKVNRSVDSARFSLSHQVSGDHDYHSQRAMSPNPMPCVYEPPTFDQMSSLNQMQPSDYDQNGSPVLAMRPESCLNDNRRFLDSNFESSILTRPNTANVIGTASILNKR